MATIVSQVFPYLAILVFLVGAGYRIGVWATSPKKLNWKLYPVPEGLVGEASYIVGEWISFKMLFKNNRAIWLGSYVFHLSLVASAIWFLLLLLGVNAPWLSRLAAAGLFFSSIYLFAARLWIPQVRAISTPVEFFNLAIFIAMGGLGWSLTGRGLSGEMRRWIFSLAGFSPSVLPDEPVLIWFVFLVEFFVAYLPFSKMFHVASKYFAFHKSRWFNPYEVRG